MVEEKKFSLGSFPNPKWVKSGRERERKKEERKSVLTMASYALQIILGGTRKPPGPKTNSMLSIHNFVIEWIRCI